MEYDREQKIIYNIGLIRSYESIGELTNEDNIKHEKLYDELYKFVRFNRDLNYENIFSIFKGMKICEEILFIVKTECEKDLLNYMFVECARCNFLNLTKYLVRLYNNEGDIRKMHNEDLKEFADCAIKYANLEYFKYLHEIFGKENLEDKKLEFTACESNKIEILEFLYSKEYKIDPSCINEACRKAHLEVIKFLVIDERFKFQLNNKDLEIALRWNNDIIINDNNINICKFDCIKFIVNQLKYYKDDNWFDRLISKGNQSKDINNTPYYPITRNTLCLARQCCNQEILDFLKSKAKEEEYKNPIFELFEKRKEAEERNRLLEEKNIRIGRKPLSGWDLV